MEVEKSKKSEDSGGDKIRKKLLEGLQVFAICYLPLVSKLHEQQQLEDTERKTEKFEAKAAACLKVFNVKDLLHEVSFRSGTFHISFEKIKDIRQSRRFQGSRFANK